MVIGFRRYEEWGLVGMKGVGYDWWNRWWKVVGEVGEVGLVDIERWKYGYGGLGI